MAAKEGGIYICPLKPIKMDCHAPRTRIPSTKVCQSALNPLVQDKKAAKKFLCLATMGSVFTCS